MEQRKSVPPKLASTSEKGFYTAVFDVPDVAFADKDVDFILHCSYGLDAKDRLMIDVDPIRIKNMFEEFVDDALADAGINVEEREVVYDSISVKTKTKTEYEDKQIRLKVTISAKADLIVVDSDGKTLN